MSTGALREKLRGLYAITDEHLIAEADFERAIEAALAGGARIVQYRDKSGNHAKRLRQAGQLRRLCSDYDALCIINDDIELAKQVEADGVHLGRDDTSLQAARQYLGDHVIIGVSCYNRLSLAQAAENETADYVAFGAMFASPSKPGALSADPAIIGRARQLLDIPVCAIGGINENNITVLTQQSVDMVAVISGLFAADDIQETAARLSRYFQGTGKTACQ